MVDYIYFDKLSSLRQQFLSDGLDHFDEFYNPPETAWPVLVDDVLYMPNTSDMRAWYWQFRASLGVSMHEREKYSPAQLRSFNRLMMEFDEHYSPAMADMTRDRRRDERKQYEKRKHNKTSADALIKRHRDNIFQIVDEYKQRMEINIPIDVQFSHRMSKAAGTAIGYWNKDKTAIARAEIRLDIKFIDMFYDKRFDLVDGVIGHEMAHVKCYTMGSLKGHDLTFKYVCKKYNIPFDSRSFVLHPSDFDK